jgi:hypothetical protein
MRALLVPLLLSASHGAGACRTPAPAPDAGPPEPWLEPGDVSLSLRAGLFTLYGIDGEFTVESPSEGTLTEDDSGDLVGRFGVALRGEVALRENVQLFAGADYRMYDIEHLNPIEELEVSIETVHSLQYMLGARYLFPTFEAAPSWRPYGELSVAYLPSVDVGFEVDLSDFGSSNLEIDTEGEGYWVGGLTAGLLYRLTKHLTAELGVLYEVPLSTLDTDLSFSIGSSTVPMFGELRPQGLIGFCGLSAAL